jgi:cytochrome c-type biogenesis protein CcmE
VNIRLKRRLVVVTGVIVIAVLAILAVVASTTASKTVTVAQATSGAFNGSRVQVTGKVVDNSYSLEGNVLSFLIYEDVEDAEDAEDADGSSEASGSGADAGASGGGTAGGATADVGVGSSGAASTADRPQLRVTYDRGVSATFGNQVTAICTGTIDQSGILVCTELVTKCPSKYESSTDALDVSQLLSYGERIVGNPVKVTGTIQAGTLTSAVGQDVRFVLIGGASANAASSSGQSAVPPSGQGDTLPVRYVGALPEELQDGSELVLTGSLNSAGQFEATVVALRG